MRTILVHLNVEAPDTDTRTADQVADALYDALVVGGDNPAVDALIVNVALAEEV